MNISAEMNQAIKRELKSLASPTQREVLMRFFKTGKGQYGEGDKFLGVKVPQTRAVVKKYAASCLLADIEKLVVSPYHEVRLAALLILCRKFKLAKGRPDEQREYVNTYLAHTDYINNWDLVDLSCYELLGNWLLDKDRDVLYEMAAPGLSLWENRIAIVTTMQFIRHGEFNDTLAIADKLLLHPHDLMHKAVGWLLREVGKRDRKLLKTYLKPRYKAMPRTMLRYAIEKFPEPLRKRYLAGKIPQPFVWSPESARRGRRSAPRKPDGSTHGKTSERL
jgi:3-methyladenine DNA glycosylase AlkD